MLEWDVEWLAVLIAVVAYQALGFLWYGPLFGTRWLQAMGKTREDIGANSTPIVISVVASIMTAIALSVVMATTDAETAADGALLGAIAGIGFSATTTITADAYQGTNPTVTWLYVVYQVLSFVIMGAILGAMS